MIYADYNATTPLEPRRWKPSLVMPLAGFCLKAPSEAPGPDVS
jgi:hypothetical protein